MSIGISDMKEINATTTYDPACSDMQEVEYTMPQSKRDITKCLMIALDNFAEAQAEIDKLLDWSYKALKHLPQSYWDSLLEITDEHRGR